MRNIIIIIIYVIDEVDRISVSSTIIIYGDANELKLLTFAPGLLG
jgi:hypothetical protein